MKALFALAALIGLSYYYVNNMNQPKHNIPEEKK